MYINVKKQKKKTFKQKAGHRYPKTPPEEGLQIFLSSLFHLQRRALRWEGGNASTKTWGWKPKRKLREECWVKAALAMGLKCFCCSEANGYRFHQIVKPTGMTTFRCTKQLSCSSFLDFRSPCSGSGFVYIKILFLQWT